jgi:hypothetical protein
MPHKQQVGMAQTRFQSGLAGIATGGGRMWMADFSDGGSWWLTV